MVRIRREVIPIARSKMDVVGLRGSVWFRLQKHGRVLSYHTDKELASREERGRFHLLLFKVVFEDDKPTQDACTNCIRSNRLVRQRRRVGLGKTDVQGRRTRTKLLPKPALASLQSSPRVSRSRQTKLWIFREGEWY